MNPVCFGLNRNMYFGTAYNVLKPQMIQWLKVNAKLYVDITYLFKTELNVFEYTATISSWTFLHIICL